MNENKARWYASYDTKAKAWRPLLCTPSFIKWGEIPISEEAGLKFEKLRIVECFEVTPEAIELAINQQYAKENHAA